jgi:tetratricopeptide (TPR) repeat protein
MRAPDSAAAALDRLDSWKEIATYLGRTVRTVQRWERDEGLPVYRHHHLAGSSVYAFINELELWLASRSKPNLTPTLPGARAPRFREGYFHYVRGRHQMRQRTLTGLLGAVREFQQSIQADPAWAPAHAALAEAYIAVSVNEWQPPSDSVALARAHAVDALAIDPSLALAHAALGLVSAFRDAQWDAASGHFRDAVALDPACATAHYWHGMVLMNRGRFDEASRCLQEAASFDPLSPVILANIGRPLLCAGDYGAAASYFQAAIDLEPRFWLAHTFLGWALEAAGRPDEAIGQFVQAVALSDNSMVAYTSLLHAQAKAGLEDEAEQMLLPLLTPGHGYVSPLRVARIYAALGRMDDVFRWLERARDDGSLINNTYPRYDPTFRPLLGNPRFEGLLRSRGI